MTCASLGTQAKVTGARLVDRGHDVHRAVDLDDHELVHGDDRAHVDDLEHHHNDGTDVHDLDDGGPGDDQTALGATPGRWAWAQGVLCSLLPSRLCVDASRVSAWLDSVLASEL